MPNKLLETHSVHSVSAQVLLPPGGVLCNHPAAVLASLSSNQHFHSISLFTIRLLCILLYPCRLEQCLAPRTVPRDDLLNEEVVLHLSPHQHVGLTRVPGTRLAFQHLFERTQ